MSTPSQHKRYPGVKPFETSERALFFGRDRDIEDLLDLVWLEKLVVLFGKSGYGKSSLINAGILPEIEQEAVPIIVRLGSYVAGQMPSPLDNLRLKIDEVLTNNPEADFINALDVPKTLWHLMKQKQQAPPTPQRGETIRPSTQKDESSLTPPFGGRGGRRFVLIFDQFEEFFTYPIADQQAFKEQVADLLYTEVPQAVRNLNDTLTDSQQTFIATPFDAKVLFAIRADRMSFLDSMKDKLPAILQKRYELKGLTEEQAKDAIKCPADKDGDFVSPKFSYSDDALRVMTQKLSETKVSQRSGIEAFQLQILCEYLEDKIIKGDIPNNRIEPQHFADKINDIYEGYYERLIDKLDPFLQYAAQLLIEEKLIFEDDKTGEARRLSVDSGVLLNEKGITQTLLNQLESTFLLRRESTSTGGFNYEVSHDTMIAPILKLRKERREIEQQEQIQMEKAKKNAERLRLEIEAEKERKRIEELQIALENASESKFRAEKAAQITAYWSLAALLSFLIALWFYYDASKQKNIALEEKAKAEKSLKDYLDAQKAKELTEFKIVLNKIKQILQGGNCPTPEQMQKMKDMKTKYPTDADLQRQIDEISLGNCR